MDDDDGYAASTASAPAAAAAFGAASADEVFLCAIDASRKEEQVMEGSMTITLNVHREVCCIHKSGGLPITIAQFLECQAL
jgi:exosome complex RNA-binding protein Rrp42 (RNase PH superfamily)